MSLGKSSRQTTVQLSPEEKEQIKAQTDLLVNTLIPQYRGVVGGAADVLAGTAQSTSDQIQNATNVNKQAQELLGGGGNYAFNQGVQGLGQTQDPNYLYQQLSDIQNAQDAVNPYAYASLQRGTEALSNTLNPNFSSEAARQAANVTNILDPYAQSAKATGVEALNRLFDQGYEQQQIDAIKNAGRETYQELAGQAAAQYGGAGQLGSARSALAQQNLASLEGNRVSQALAQYKGQLESQRAQTAQGLLNYGQQATGQALGLQGQATGLAGQAAQQLQAQGQQGLNQGAQIAQQAEANRLAAGGQLANIGAEAVGGAQGAAQNLVNLAGLPQDLYNKYAQVIYGSPGSQGANFTGTRNTSTRSSQFGLDLSSLLKGGLPGT